MNDREKLDAIQKRIDEAFSADADKWQRDKHLALEDIEKLAQRKRDED